MIPITPILLKDGYKVGHKFQYPDDTEYIYSNFTARTARYADADYVISFGLQYFLKEYLQNQFNDNFFWQDKDKILAMYKRRIDNYLGKDSIKYDHIERLHDLQYLPLKIKALPEGTKVPAGVPLLTIINTDPEFFWLTNMLETMMSNLLWKGSTSATTAFQFRKKFEEYAELTGGNKDFIKWQGHDFSFRGMSGIEDALLSGAAHLTCFTGTDTIPAIDFLENYYGANSDKELIGGSVPATEHSVMSMGTKNSEIETYRRLVSKVYPSGILSIVSDTWDLWNVSDNILPAIKSEILARNGKIVIRPDSGDPVKIVCGDEDHKGLAERLWDVFGGTINEKGYKILDPHIGIIYGDSINLDRQARMLEGLRLKGFASTNIVLGIGSYTYEYVTRDTYGFVMKSTWGQTKSGGSMPIFKDPKTSEGTKTSHIGLLSVLEDYNGILFCRQNCTKEQEEQGELKVVFENGELRNEQNLFKIRNRVEAELDEQEVI
jgi:nicotinamide phosphoribosyltransferase